MEDTFTQDDVLCDQCDRPALYECECVRCPTCGHSDQVEDSISPEKYDGYCYRCKGPFKL